MIEARQAIAQGSKSFFLASLLLPPDTRQDVWTLYRWCRHCDDQVDQPPEKANAEAALERLKKQTLLALRGESDHPVFSSLGQVVMKHKIPANHPLELLNGFARDVHGDVYHTVEDLESYAYQVAGVVGEMMVPLMGVKNPGAFSHAIAMGNAMQLTNIARDVHEDFLKGRCYLPEQWLQERDISKQDLLNPAHQHSLFEIVLQILDRAEELYLQGYRGLRYLPWRAAFAVASAAEIYSRIGTKIRKGGPTVISKRVYVSRLEKLWLLMRGCQRMIRSRYERS